MNILLATTNSHKLEEIRAIINDPAVRLLSLSDLPEDVEEPVEDQPTFEGNALLKARHYAAASAMITLADDSGLEVAALGAEPGVHSARYSGRDGPRGVVDPANNRRLLERLGRLPPEQRGARFVCVMALVPPPVGESGVRSPESRVIPDSTLDSGLWTRDSRLRDPTIVRGTVEGRILTAQECADPAKPEAGRGENGFGYDPIFLITELDRTAAELPPKEKNRVSHRARAARKMWERLQPSLRDG